MFICFKKSRTHCHWAKPLLMQLSLVEPFNKANIFLDLISYELNSLLVASHLVYYVSVHIRFNLKRYLLNTAAEYHDSFQPGIIQVKLGGSVYPFEICLTITLLQAINIMYLPSPIPTPYFHFSSSDCFKISSRITCKIRIYIIILTT